MPPRDNVLYSRCPVVPTSSSLAYKLGYLQDELGNEPGLAFDMQVVTLEPKLHPAHDERYWLRHAGHPKALWARSEGADTRVVALSWVDGSYPIVARTQSGIASPADLKGKRVAVARIHGSSSLDLVRAQHLKTYDTALQSAGLGLGDVEQVQFDFGHEIMQGPKSVKAKNVFEIMAAEFLTAMIRGTIDAAATQLPAAVTNLLDIREVYDTRNHPSIAARVNPTVLRAVVVSGPLHRDHRDVVVRLVARLLSAGQWAQAHPDDVASLVADDMKTSAERLTNAYGDLSRGVQIDINDELVGALGAHKDFLLRQAFIARDFSIDDWVDRSIVRDARLLLQKRTASQAA